MFQTSHQESYPEKWSYAIEKWPLDSGQLWDWLVMGWHYKVAPHQL